MTTVPDNRNYAPDLDELEQREDVAPTAVAVKLEGTTLTHELPSRTGVMRCVRVGDVGAEPILNFDLARKGGQVEAIDQDIYVGTSVQAVLDGTGALVKAGKVAPVLHCGQVFARCATAGQTAQVNVFTGEYAD